MNHKAPSVTQKTDMLMVSDYLGQHQSRMVGELIEWLSIPSVSADARYKEHVSSAAEWIRLKIMEAGADRAELYPTDGHPIVYAEAFAGTDAPTVLVYGHYDVQPPDPLELWLSPPFEPEIRRTELHPEGAIFARGACDDKGQAYMHVKALEIMKQLGDLPCNIKILFEGEEEVGSVHLEQFCRQYADMLSCDAVLISDTALIAREVPAITVGLRGLSYLEVEVTGPAKDLHSGVYGGAVVNPINALTRMLASMTDEHGRITIPGFYNKVQELNATERATMAQIPYDEQAYMAELDVAALDGEKGYSTLERASVRPTFDINGIWGGYTGAGAKTVLPSKAYAKVSMRLVPDQDPAEITDLFTRHFERIAPAGVRVAVNPHHGGMPAITPTDSTEYRAAAMAMKQTFGTEPLPVRGGGSIPIVALFEQVLGVKSLLMGFGLDSDDIHSPNEHYGLFHFTRGIETIPHFYRFYQQLRAENRHFSA